MRKATERLKKRLDSAEKKKGTLWLPKASEQEGAIQF